MTLRNWIGIKYISRETSTQKIVWKFIPPTAAWWGGWWERLVRIIKELLRHSLGKSILSYEELSTVICDCEFSINSRPLTYISENLQELIPLTPAMFLIENRCSDTTNIDELNSRDLRKRMKYRIKLLSDLRQRFRKEYLSELIQKQDDNRVREPRIGEMVLIGNDNKKRLSWPIAKIIELIPGRDGEIRTVRLKTQHGTVIRPVQRIFPLEVQAIANSDKELKEESISVKSTKPEKVLNTNDAIVKKYTSSGRLVKEPKRLDLLNYNCYRVLITRFEKAVPLSTRLQLFSSCIQGSSESVQEFAARINKLGTQIFHSSDTAQNTAVRNANDQLLQSRFISGLRNDIRRFVLARDPINLEESITAALIEEQNVKLNQIANDERSGLSPSQTETSVISALTNKLQEINLRFERLQEASSVTVRKTGGDLFRRRETVFKCFYCGFQEHRQAECRKKRMDKRRANYQSPRRNAASEFSVFRHLSTHSSNRAFARSTVELSAAATEHHRISLQHDYPIKCPIYKIPFSLRNEFRRQIADLEKEGIISKSNSQYNTPALFVKQKEKWRLVLDFRKLNEITLTQDFVIPTLDDILHEISGSNYFSALDMKSAFNQIPLHFADRNKTAFSTPDGDKYEFNRLCFGLKNSPKAFQSIAQEVLGDLLHNGALVYIDDIILFTKTIDEHFELLGKAFERFERIHLKFNPSKCQFLTNSCKFWGVVVTPEGILIDKDKSVSINEFPVPTGQKQIKSFLGCCNFYRRYIKNFAKRALPLTNLLRKDTPFEWISETQEAFDDIKKAILNPPVLALPDPDAELQITTDASSRGIGAVLEQKYPNSEVKPLYFFQRN
ncbi:retrovirus-related Pol polyprotein from transposon 17.6 [Trichonephila clavipes]|nr:retrovirus-related Pol polyprotein from transposon 17.6 [Trichonephila clavipes]